MLISFYTVDSCCCFKGDYAYIADFTYIGKVKLQYGIKDQDPQPQLKNGMAFKSV